MCEPVNTPTTDTTPAEPYNGLKIDQDRPLLPLGNPAAVRELALESVYYGYTIYELADRVNMHSYLLRQDADRLRIPYVRDNSAKFFDPRWKLPVFAHDPVLGALVRKEDLGVAAPSGSMWPRVMRLATFDVIPVAALAVAQYRLGYLPPDIALPDSIAFRDGDNTNLRPENVVYTGTAKLQRPSIRVTYGELPPVEYRVRCARCRYRLPRDKEPVGWCNMDYVSLVYADQTDPRHKGVTQILNGILCPVCQKFTHRVWNRSLA